MHYRVTAGTPAWHLNGVNRVTATLVRGLIARGVESEILLTGPEKTQVALADLPADIPIRSLKSGFGFKQRLRSLERDLSSHGPRVYLPGYDYAHSGVCGSLGNDVVTVGVLHSDDPLHYAHAERLGSFWNAIVCVSERIEKEARAQFPELGSRLLTIHNGVDLPETPPNRTDSRSDRLQIVFASRIEQKQKRVFDLADLLGRIRSLFVKATLTVVGDGSSLAALRQRCEEFESAGAVRFTGRLPHSEVVELFNRSDLFLLTSDFEGLPISLLEAMARGCVPIVTDIESGIPEIIEHGRNGFRLPVGDMESFATHIQMLEKDIARRSSLSKSAAATISEKGFTTDSMCAQYLDLFERLFDEAKRGDFQRPNKGIIIPPELTAINRLRGYLGHPRQRLRKFLQKDGRA